MKFSYRVITSFTLTKAEIEHLMNVSAKHYDSKCQQAHEPGGIIYGWKNQLWDKNEVELEATIRELDLITKILEVECYLNHTSHIVEEAKRLNLGQKFNSLAKAACEESERINK